MSVFSAWKNSKPKEKKKGEDFRDSMEPTKDVVPHSTIMGF